MPISWREALTGRWAVLVYSDPYTVAELERAMVEILAHAISAPPFRLLVDRRHCQAPTPAFVKHIAALLDQHRERVAGGHVAMVTSDEVGFGAARMTEIMVEVQGVPCTLRAFRDWAEAERWLDDGHGSSV
ncbi:MAG TPA: hypothetical protein VMO26_13895 [Vicinamibacterales bacterium]|nr:hypothetical protein [Vicinamibacterales bacterium]